jgi:hypothetical protein
MGDAGTMKSLFLEHKLPNGTTETWEPSATEAEDVASMASLGWQPIPLPVYGAVLPYAIPLADPDATDDPDDDLLEALSQAADQAKPGPSVPFEFEKPPASIFGHMLSGAPVVSQGNGSVTKPCSIHAEPNANCSMCDAWGKRDEAAKGKLPSDRITELTDEIFEKLTANETRDYMLAHGQEIRERVLPRGILRYLDERFGRA